MLLHKNRLALFPNDRLGMIVSLRYPINSTRGTNCKNLKLCRTLQQIMDL